MTTFKNQQSPLHWMLLPQSDAVTERDHQPSVLVRIAVLVQESLMLCKPGRCTRSHIGWILHNSARYQPWNQLPKSYKMRTSCPHLYPASYSYRFKHRRSAQTTPLPATPNSTFPLYLTNILFCLQDAVFFTLHRSYLHCPDLGLSNGDCR